MLAVTAPLAVVVAIALTTSCSRTPDSSASSDATLTSSTSTCSPTLAKNRARNVVNRIATINGHNPAAWTTGAAIADMHFFTVHTKQIQSGQTTVHTVRLAKSTCIIREYSRTGYESPALQGAVCHPTLAKNRSRNLVNIIAQIHGPNVLQIGGAGLEEVPDILFFDAQGSYHAEHLVKTVAGIQVYTPMLSMADCRIQRFTNNPLALALVAEPALTR